MSRTHSRLVKFEQDFRGVDLANYYQLKQGPQESTTIETTVQSNQILFTMHYQKSVTPQNIRLPLELIRHIYGYLTYHIQVDTKIEYSSHYPFAPPIWYMEKVTHTLPHTGYEPLYLLDYFIDKIRQHNHLYHILLLEGTQWTPAISVEKDMLMFVARIHHFDEILKTMGVY